ITPEGILTVERGDDDRGQSPQIIHPRCALRIGPKIVGCNGDNITITLLSDVDWIHGERARAAGDNPIYDPQIAKTQLKDVGLQSCENLVYKSNADLIISSSRGHSGEPGGLASWRLPLTESDPPEPVSLLSSKAVIQGVAGLAINNNRLFAVSLPNTLSIYDVDEDGNFETLSSTPIPDATALDSVLIEGDYAILSDAGGQQLFVMQASDPANVSLTASIKTLGVPRAMAALGDGIIAVAEGGAGIQLIDVSAPDKPVLSATYDTPGSATHLSAYQGYLGVADWDTVRLYDASQRGVLRLLDAANLQGMLQIHTFVEEDELERFGMTEVGSTRRQMHAANWVDLSENGFIVSEMDAVIMGRLRAGGRAPRINLHTLREKYVTLPHSFDAVVSNGGRKSLAVSWDTTNGISSPHESLIVAPGESWVARASINEITDQKAPTKATLLSNDPEFGEFHVQLMQQTATFDIGNSAADFSLGLINECTSGACTQTPRCVSNSDYSAKGMPVLLVFFASWSPFSGLELSDLFHQLRSQYAENKLTIMAVSWQESEESVFDFVTEHGIDELVLMDNGVNAENCGDPNPQTLYDTYFSSVGDPNNDFFFLLKI
ncbi:MAG TPA: redoxin domain-containing protein, partial [Myxococcales bacterium]|nr:redoxin domain-containing protein [Myxococcales bacterium]